jgi:enoyl-CoA hydratase
MDTQSIHTAIHGEGALKVALITLNRPKQLNALNDALMDELGAALAAYDADDAIGCIVITGNERAFAAGADIGAMATKTYMEAYKGDFITRNWERMRTVRKPVIAAVAGFALGGGCELAMMCDFIIAADTARFGQPEIKLGIIPGAGGTQRLPRAVGKAKAMDLVLTGRMMDAAEAERSGLVSRVVPSRGRSPKAWPTSGGSSTRCSAPTTSARAWRPSSPSARRCSSTAEGSLRPRRRPLRPTTRLRARPSRGSGGRPARSRARRARRTPRRAPRARACAGS